jgi:hypothetical protein
MCPYTTIRTDLGTMAIGWGERGVSRILLPAAAVMRIEGQAIRKRLQRFVAKGVGFSAARRGPARTVRVRSVIEMNGRAWYQGGVGGSVIE